MQLSRFVSWHKNTVFVGLYLMYRPHWSHLLYQVLSVEYSPQLALMLKILPHKLQKRRHFLIEPLKTPVSLVPVFVHVMLIQPDIVIDFLSFSTLPQGCHVSYYSNSWRRYWRQQKSIWVSVVPFSSPATSN